MTYTGPVQGTENVKNSRTTTKFKFENGQESTGIFYILTPLTKECWGTSLRI